MKATGIASNVANLTYNMVIINSKNHSANIVLLT